MENGAGALRIWGMVKGTESKNKVIAKNSLKILFNRNCVRQFRIEENNALASGQSVVFVEKNNL